MIPWGLEKIRGWQLNQSTTDVTYRGNRQLKHSSYVIFDVVLHSNGNIKDFNPSYLMKNLSDGH